MTAASPTRPAPFVPLPDYARLDMAWPTPNRSLLSAPDRFFARTRVNPAYGRPGWTRDCGRRLHKGCDIAPVNVVATGRSTTVQFTDCATGREFPSREPTWIPQDRVFCVFDGRVEEAVTDPTTSDFGIHAVIQHLWPGTQISFYSLYAHLAELQVREQEQVPAGHPLGLMGTSSRIADARNWMSVAPHLHIEFWDATRTPFDPEAFLRAHLAP